VFLMHQGYHFLFMRGDGPDPQVWSYSEGALPNMPVQSHASFTDWLDATVKQQTQAWARLEPSYDAEKRKRRRARVLRRGDGSPDGQIGSYPLCR
jgi:hypothetical protein